MSVDWLEDASNRDTFPIRPIHLFRAMNDETPQGSTAERIGWYLLLPINIVRFLLAIPFNILNVALMPVCAATAFLVKRWLRGGNHGIRWIMCLPLLGLNSVLMASCKALTFLTDNILLPEGFLQWWMKRVMSRRKGDDVN